MAKQLSEIELKQLSSIAYLDIIGDDSEIAYAYNRNDEEITLGEVIDYYTAQGNYKGNPEGPQKLAERFTGENWGEKSELDHWNELLATLDNPKQRSWVISDIESCNKPHETGFVACTITPNEGVSVVAFRGSDPFADPKHLNDWKNNFRSSYMPTNEQQKQAAAYLQRIADNKEIGDLYLTGHSLGGNLALFATINMPEALNGNLINCSTYGAPGMNKVTFKSHSKTIYRLEQENKIFEFQNKYDPVGSILHNVSTPIIIESMNPSVDNLINHSLFYMATGKDNNGNDILERSEIQEKDFLCTVVSRVTNGFEALPIEQKALVVEAVLPLLEDLMKNGNWYGKVLARELIHMLETPNIAGLAVVGLGAAALVVISGVVVARLYLLGLVNEGLANAYLETADLMVKLQTIPLEGNTVMEMIIGLMVIILSYIMQVASYMHIILPIT